MLNKGSLDKHQLFRYALTLPFPSRLEQHPIRARGSHTPAPSPTREHHPCLHQCSPCQGSEGQGGHALGSPCPGRLHSLLHLGSSGHHHGARGLSLPTQALRTDALWHIVPWVLRTFLVLSHICLHEKRWLLISSCGSSGSSTPWKWPESMQVFS